MSSGSPRQEVSSHFTSEFVYWRPQSSYVLPLNGHHELPFGKGCAKAEWCARGPRFRTHFLQSTSSTFSFASTPKLAPLGFFFSSLRRSTCQRGLLTFSRNNFAPEPKVLARFASEQQGCPSEGVSHSWSRFQDFESVCIDAHTGGRVPTRVHVDVGTSWGSFFSVHGRRFLLITYQSSLAGVHRRPTIYTLNKIVHFSEEVGHHGCTAGGNSTTSNTCSVMREFFTRFHVGVGTS